MRKSNPTYRSLGTAYRVDGETDGGVSVGILDHRKPDGRARRETWMQRLQKAGGIRIAVT
jgi:hypothetical protein